jgi:hypothetical protein
VKVVGAYLGVMEKNMKRSLLCVISVCLQTGTHPRLTTLKNIDRFRNQVKYLLFEPLYCTAIIASMKLLHCDLLAYGTLNVIYHGHTMQLKALGFSYDWQREISTTEPDYYKWTQWIFLQLFKRGLAYQVNLTELYFFIPCIIQLPVLFLKPFIRGHCVP